MFFNIGESKVKIGSGVITPEREASFPFRLYTFGAPDGKYFKSAEDAENSFGEFASVDNELSGTGIELDPWTARELLMDDNITADDAGFDRDTFYIGNFSNVYSGTQDNYLVRRHSDGHYSYYARQVIPVDIKGEGYSSSAYTTYSYNPNSYYYLIRYGNNGEAIYNYEYLLGGYNISAPDAILFAAVDYSGDYPAGVTMLGTMSEGTYDWRYLPGDGFGTKSRSLCEIDVYTGEVVKVIAGGHTWSSQYYGDRDIVIEKGKCYCFFEYNSSYSNVAAHWGPGWISTLERSGFQTTFEM